LTLRINPVSCTCNSLNAGNSEVTEANAFSTNNVDVLATRC